MARNDQLSFPVDPERFLDPYDKEYREKLKLMDLLEPGENTFEAENRLRKAAETISDAFSWDETIEGYQFWGHAYDALESMADELVRRRGGLYESEFDVPEDYLDFPDWDTILGVDDVDTT